MNPVKCPKCGKINDGNLDFCIYCGAIFEESQPENDKFILDLRHTGKNKDSYSPYDSITYPNDERRSDEQRPLCQKARLYTTQHFNLLGNADWRFGFNRPDGSKRFVKSNEYNTTRESDSECKCEFNQHIWIVSYLFFLI